MLVLDRLLKDYRKIMIQVPDGLRNLALSLAKYLEGSGKECIVSLDHCYGACDLRDKEAKAIGCDLLLHVGHTKFYRKFNTALPVVYLPIYIDVKIQIKKKEIEKIKEKKIGVCAPLPFLHLLKEVASMVKKYKDVIILGQVLGCKVPDADVDAYLVISSGDFYVPGKKVYILDVEKGKIIEHVKKEKIRFGRIMKVMSAKTFGIIVSTKPGQKELQGSVKKIKRLLEQKGKTAFILSMDGVTNEKLQGLKIDAFINTACPRLIENHFDKPVINAKDLELVFF